MEELLNKARKEAQQAEVFRVSGKRTEAVFEANHLKQIQTKESEGTALRLVKAGRIGFAATTRPDGLHDLLEMAVEVVSFGAEARFELPGPQSYSPITVYDPDMESLAEETMVQLGQSLIDRIREAESEIVCEGSVSRNTSRVEIINSYGGTASYQKSTCSIMVEGVLVRGTDMLFVGDHDRSCHPIITPDRVAQSTLEQLERAKEIAVSPSGKVPVIFTPHGVASALISPLTVAFNGKMVLRGASPLIDKKDEQVLAPQFSLFDDATIDFCPSASICDDEGIPSRRTALIEKGIVKNFVYDLQTAGEAGTESTGNASRSVASLPAPAMNALIIEDGNTGFDDMLAGIREGLVVEQLMGATQGNILGGDFSGNVLLGYKIENGRIVGRVKNVMVSGNVYELLKDGITIGNDSRWLGGAMKTPSIMCPSVAVAATG